VRGIPGAVADNGAGGGRRWATSRTQAVPAGFAARAPRVGEGDGDRGLELSSAGKFENTRDLASDLLGAKNAGVTNLPHLK
jgi:hypothetical protein